MALEIAFIRTFWCFTLKQNHKQENVVEYWFDFMFLYIFKLGVAFLSIVNEFDVRTSLQITWGCDASRFQLVCMF
jgi:hypothetical protein